MSEMTPQDAARADLGRFLVPGKRYPLPLPPELEAWYCYTTDGGHSILVVLAGHYREGEDLRGELMPAPVKSVLRGYTVRGGYIVCDLEYDPNRGLITPEEDDEF